MAAIRAVAAFISERAMDRLAARTDPETENVTPGGRAENPSVVTRRSTFGR
jgi:hypothetical protein